MNFENVLKFLQKFFDKEGMDYALIGGLALSAYGISRTTIDVDMLTHLDNRDRIVRFLESLGYETLARSEAFSNHEHPISDMGRIDLLYVSGDTAKTVLKEAREHPIFIDQKIKVVKPEHLVALKLFSKSANPARHNQETEDIRNLLALEQIDLEEVKGYFLKFASLEEFDKVLEGMD